ncbi:SigE family RNA polymerase sigma factor [Kibdelosporangium aridum]|uniref:RNA polymerase sigma factor n=1 Tax=Kibdelosporangium aridum TaxID=2030 RepID=A0A428YZG0_KIBAR|nr:sigma-70 family RNA polymerase sigma factor [Kibdelosporangium aridum]RSM76965.1 SigE family RNA polymerase sigma factor [Kibdelosporangium aridum]
MTESDWFAALYRGAYQELVLAVFALTRDLAEAEDVVQEAFAVAYRRRERVRHVDNQVAWLRTVAINLARKRWRRREMFDRLLGRHRAEPDLPAELGTDRADLHAVIHELGQEYRSVIVLHYLADLPVDEVASLLDVPVGTVKSRLSRARAALAGQLSEHAKENDHA